MNTREALAAVTRFCSDHVAANTPGVGEALVIIERALGEVMTKPITPASPEQGERCPDCGFPTCRKRAVQPWKSVERLGCYERTITRLRSELAASRALNELERAVVGAAREAVEFMHPHASYTRKLRQALSALGAPAQAEPICLGCHRPFASPDHDPRCSSCVESGTGPEPSPVLADRARDQNCYCSDYLSSGMPCPPGRCPNVPAPTEPREP